MGASEAILHRIGEARMSFHLADSCPAEALAAFRSVHPDHIAVSYINCSAAVKALSNLICTSNNAVDLVKQLPAGRRSSNESKV